MPKRKPVKENVGYSKVRTIERTLFGKVLVTAGQHNHKLWSITLEYPVIGPDPVAVTFAEDVPYEEVKHVRALEDYCAKHFEDIGQTVSAMRKVRYGRRREKLSDR